MTMTPREKVELKPCPFCGGSDIRFDCHRGAGRHEHRGDDVWSMCCYDCGATFPNMYRKDGLVEAWNRRTALASGSGDHAELDDASIRLASIELSDGGCGYCDALMDVYASQPRKKFYDDVRTILAENAALRAKSDPSNWRDREDQWSKAVKEAHPVNSTDPDRHKHFDTAMSMVGNRHGKYELVGLVHWLLTRATEAERKLAEACDWIRAQDCECHLVYTSGMCVRCTFLSKEAERG